MNMFDILLAQARAAAQLSIYALSQETGISELRLAQMEAGEAQEIGEREIYLLCREFGWEMAQVLPRVGLDASPYLQLTPYCQEQYLKVREALEQVLGSRPYVFWVVSDLEAKAPNEEAIFLDGSCGMVIRNCRRELRLKLGADTGATEYIAGESVCQEQFLVPAVTFTTVLAAVQWLDAN